MCVLLTVTEGYVLAGGSCSLSLLSSSSALTASCNPGKRFSYSAGSASD